MTSTYEGGIKSIKSDHSTCLNQQARKRKPKPLRVCSVSGWSVCSASRITLSEIIMLLSSPLSQHGALRGAETEDRFSSAVSLTLTHLKGTIMFNRTRSAQASDPRCCALFVCFPPHRRDPRGVIPREKESPPPPAPGFVSWAIPALWALLGTSREHPSFALCLRELHPGRHTSLDLFRCSWENGIIQREFLFKK